MKLLSLALIVLVVAISTACGTAARRHLETSKQVAAFIRHTWGTTAGFPQFAYSCRRLDQTGRLFTCLARDHFEFIKLASFDVVCDASCKWTAYPTYVG